MLVKTCTSSEIYCIVFILLNTAKYSRIRPPAQPSKVNIITESRFLRELANQVRRKVWRQKQEDLHKNSGAFVANLEFNSFLQSKSPFFLFSYCLSTHFLKIFLHPAFYFRYLRKLVQILDNCYCLPWTTTIDYIFSFFKQQNRQIQHQNLVVASR